MAKLSNLAKRHAPNAFAFVRARICNKTAFWSTIAAGCGKQAGPEQTYPGLLLILVAALAVSKNCTNLADHSVASNLYWGVTTTGTSLFIGCSGGSCAIHIARPIHGPRGSKRTSANLAKGDSTNSVGADTTLCWKLLRSTLHTNPCFLG